VAAVTARHEPWTYQAAFWGLAILLFFPPCFRGLFFATEQQRVLILAAVLFWFVWLWKHNCRDYKFLSHPLYTGQAFYLLGKLPEAEKDLQNAAGDEQAKGEALVWLALVKEKQGKTQEAKELVNQASDINKTYGNAFEQLKTLPVL
jgi:tetratricopeptide (TPR) repeat protein